MMTDLKRREPRERALIAPEEESPQGPDSPAGNAPEPGSAEEGGE